MSRAAPWFRVETDGPAILGAVLVALAMLGPDPEASESLRGLGLEAVLGIYEAWRDRLPLPEHDKLIHGLMFGGLAALFHRSLAARGWSRALAKSAMITLVYSIVLEILQVLRADRGSEVADLMANGVGVGLYALLALGASKLASRSAPVVATRR